MCVLWYSIVKSVNICNLHRNMLVKRSNFAFLVEAIYNRLLHIGKYPSHSYTSLIVGRKIRINSFFVGSNIPLKVNLIAAFYRKTSSIL